VRCTSSAWRHLGPTIQQSQRPVAPRPSRDVCVHAAENMCILDSVAVWPSSPSAAGHPARRPHTLIASPVGECRPSAMPPGESSGRGRPFRAHHDARDQTPLLQLVIIRNKALPNGLLPFGWRGIATESEHVPTPCPCIGSHPSQIMSDNSSGYRSQPSILPQSHIEILQRAVHHAEPRTRALI
jgi:hypothetical protein